MFCKNILLVLFIIKASCLTESSSSASLSLALSKLALPGCQERCGNVTIPYPFGITPDCSSHEAYSVTCNTSFVPPKPFITSINLEVLEISLEAGTIRVNNPLLTTYNCLNRTGHWVVNFTHTPFAYSSTSTRFTAIGCNMLAYYIGRANILDVIGSCLSFCGTGMIILTNTCYGNLCCQTQISDNTVFLQALIESNIGSGNDEKECMYAFLVDFDWFSKLDDINEVQNMATVPVVLDWRLYGNCNAFGPVFADPNKTGCGINAFCTTNTRLCSCLPGYQGNPYLPLLGGCQDVDECASFLTND